jgi:hypothetical protein
MREAPSIDRQRIENGLAFWTGLLFFGLLLAAPLSVAVAVPKGPAGQTCKRSGTTTVEGKEEGTGRKMKCTADYCVYDDLESSPEGIKRVERTHYSNVRDCQPAALGVRPRFQGVKPPAGTLQKSP